MPGRRHVCPLIPAGKVTQLEPAVLDVGPDQQVLYRRQIGSRLNHTGADFEIGRIGRRLE